MRAVRKSASSVLGSLCPAPPCFPYSCILLQKHFLFIPEGKTFVSFSSLSLVPQRVPGMW